MEVILFLRVKSNFRSSDNNECICLEPIESDISAILPCGHQFHQTCIESWFDVCRLSFVLMSTKCSTDRKY